MSENNAPYIKNVKLKGYKSIKDLEIDLLPGLNIIIGPNGSGKSNFLEFLYKALFEQGVVGMTSPYHFQISLQSAAKNIVWEQEFEGRYTEYEDLGFKTPIVKTKILQDDVIEKEATGYSGQDFILKKIDSNYKFRFLVFPIKINFQYPFAQKDTLIEGLSMLDKPSYYKFIDGEIVDNPPTPGIFENNIEKEFYNISDFTTIDKTVLLDKKLEINKDLIANLKDYSPIQNLRIDPNISIYKNQLNNIFLQFFVSDEWFSWNDLSDGTKRIFSIIKTILNFDRLILLEEPEIGVHPTQLFSLMNFLISQAKHKQIIVSTHSPQVLNTLASYQLQSIIVAEMTDKGTKMRHLTEKQIKKAKNYMATELSLGDYWLHSDLEPQNTAL